MGSMDLQRFHQSQVVLRCKAEVFCGILEKIYPCVRIRTKVLSATISTIVEICQRSAQIPQFSRKCKLSGTDTTRRIVEAFGMTTDCHAEGGASGRIYRGDCG